MFWHWRWTFRVLEKLSYCQRVDSHLHAEPFTVCFLPLPTCPPISWPHPVRDILLNVYLLNNRVNAGIWLSKVLLMYCRLFSQSRIRAFIHWEVLNSLSPNSISLVMLVSEHEVGGSHFLRVHIEPVHGALLHVRLAQASPQQELF